MLPYITVLLVILLCTLFDKKAYDNYIFYMASFFLFIFSSFRYGGFFTGDYFTYISFSKKVISFDDVLDKNVPVEIAFRLISYIGNSLHLPENFVIVIMGGLSLLPVLFVIHKYSEYKIFSLLILLPYLFTMNMHSARTSVAAGFGLLFIMFIYERKFIRAAISFLLALSFHTLSLGLIFISLVYLPSSALFFILLFVIAFVIVFNPLIIFSKILSLIGLGGVSAKLIGYSQSVSFGQGLNLYDPRCILVLLVISLFIINKRYLVKSVNVYLSKVFIIGGIVMFLFSPLVIVSWRVSYLFLLSGIVLIPNLCFFYNLQIYDKVNIKRFMTLFFCVIYLLYCGALIYTSQDYNFILWPSEETS